jgi:dTDP-4-dehydrorhamnose reductase
MKKILVLGHKSFIAQHLPYDKIKERIFLDDEYVYGLLDKYKPDVLINTIGFTGSPNIDQCEIERVKTYETNTLIPGLLASACEKLDIRFLHFGSGCIFSGKSPNTLQFYSSLTTNRDSGFKETDYANPVSYYSKTKYAADLMIGDLKNVSILRLRMPISPLNHPRNLLNKLIGYKDIVEELNSVSFTDDIPIAIEHILKNDLTGIYNLTSRTPIKHSQLLDEIKKYIPTFSYNKITAEALDKLTVGRRSNCVLDNTKIWQKCISMVDTEKHIPIVVKQWIENRNKEIL